MTLLRIAAGLAFNAAPEHRWRRLSVFVSSALFLTFLLAASSIVALVLREAERSTVRTAVLADRPSDSDLLLVERWDDWRKQTIVVTWLQPASDAVPAIVPPGVAELPAAGETAVSPALDQLAAQHPELAARYPNRSVIGYDGVRAGGELFAYAVPEAGRSIGDADEALRIEQGQVVGQGPAYRIGRFGAPGNAAGYLALGEPQSVPIGPALGGLTAGLGIPAILILAVGAAAASETRNRRFTILRALGARARTVGTLSVFETLLLAVPGLVVALLTWAVAGPWLTVVPLVRYQVVPGDLALPWWVLFGLLAAAIAATAAIAWMLSAISERRMGRPRPGPSRTPLLAIRALPIALAIGAFGLGRTIGGYSQSDYYLIGFVLAVAGLPALVPIVLRAVGRLLARARTASVHLAARGMEWDPVRAARPFIAGAALLFLVLAGAAFVGLSRETEELSTPSTAGAATIEWQDARPGDLAQLQAAFGTGLAVPLSEKGEHDHGGAGPSDHEHSGRLLIGATCPELADYLPGSQCDPRSAMTLPDAMRPAVGSWLAQVLHEPAGEIELVEPASLADTGSALLLDRQSVTQVDERARNAAMGRLPAPSVRSAFSASTRESPLVPWLIGTLTFAAGALAFACLLAIIDRLLGLADAHRRLVNIGISRPKLARLTALNFALPYFSVLLVSLAAGLSACAVLLLPTSSMPMAAIGVTAMLGTACGLLGSISVAVLGARSAFADRD